MTVGTAASRSLASLALLVALAAVLFWFSRREQREYADKLADYEKGESEYAKLARATGGDQLYLDPNTDLSAYLVGQVLDAVIWKQIGTLDGAGEAEIPVDSSVRKLGLSILGSSGRGDAPFTLTALGPGGRRVEGEGEGVHATLTKNGAIYAIDSPAPGVWKLRFEGKGSYQLAAKSESKVTWNRVRFVERGGRPGHEGWFPLSGRLRVGAEQTFEAGITGPLPERPELSIVDELGGQIAKAAIASSSSSSDRDLSEPPLDLLGRIVVPGRTFRFVLKAGDVQRVYDEIFNPQASQRTYSWTYRSSTPDSDCALVDFLLLTAQGTREIDQVIWTCARHQTSTEENVVGSATLMIAAAELPDAGISMIFEGRNRLGDGPLELSRDDCERYVALFEKLRADPVELPPPPSLRARCTSSGATAHIELRVTAASDAPLAR
jgi:hypothetical protein